ncbi:MAG: hypothetical protein NZM25_06710 [Leptospiraceae bacterium]|nr:hypothetical protein [Leptospiraceae bacterium]MDW8306875.1 flagellar filament outer layer protein FlaA [Leptospiraceae bacterium]
MRLWPGLFFLVFPVGAESFWQDLLKSGRYDFYLIEDFEEPRSWRFGEAKAVPSFSRTVMVDFPQNYREHEKEAAELFLNDQVLATKSAALFGRKTLERESSQKNRARELFLSFMHPGKERASYLLEKPLTLLGSARSLTFYVKSHQYRHSLFVLISSPGLGVQELYAGDLDFEGWRRFETKLPAFYLRRNPQRQNFYEITFHGFSVKSHFRENPGFCHLVLDQITLLIDRSEEFLPGALQKDNWR